VKNRQNGQKAASDGETFHVIYEIDVAESISSDRFMIEVELIHLLRMHRHIVMFETDVIGQTPSWLEHCLVIFNTFVILV